MTSTIELHTTASRACAPSRGPLRTVTPASPSVGAALCNGRISIGDQLVGALVEGLLGDSTSNGVELVPDTEDRVIGLDVEELTP